LFSHAIFPHESLNDARSHVIQVVGGIVVLLGSYFAARNVTVARAQQSSQLLSTAFDQLGSSNTAVRIGAIRRLEKIAREDTHSAALIRDALQAIAEPDKADEKKIATDALGKLP
jgi:hypothetical protein